MTISRGRIRRIVHAARANSPGLRSHIPRRARRAVRIVRATGLDLADVFTHPITTSRLGWGRGPRASYPAYSEEMRARVRRVGGITVGGITVVGLLGTAPLFGRRADRALVVRRLTRWAGITSVSMLVARQRWSERSARGRRHRLPPGRLSNLAAYAVDPELFRCAFARHGPIVKTTAGMRRVVAVQGIERSAHILRERRDVLVPHGFPMSRLVPGGFIRDMREPDHSQYRELLGSAFREPVVAAVEPVLRRILERAVDDARRAGVPIEVGPWIERTFFRAWFTVFFGFETDDDEHSRLRNDYAVFDWRVTVTGLPEEFEAFASASDEIRRHIAEWAKREPADWPACATAALLSGDVEALDDPKLFGNLVLLLRTSSADTHGLATWVVHHLDDDPRLVATLRRELVADVATTAPDLDPSAPWAHGAHGAHGAAPSFAAPSFASRLVSETVRLHQSEAVHRIVAEEFEHEGLRFPKGWELRACVAESHRDPLHFVEPDTFDPDRFLDGPPPRMHYAPFGMDRHACLGEGLARMATRVLAESLVDRADWVSSGPHRIVFGEWRHWAPDPRWSITLRERSSTQIGDEPERE